MTRSLDLSMIINVHREGELCQPTVESAKRALEMARAGGLRCELIIVLDSCDAVTLKVAERARPLAQLESMACGDLGEARNHGVAVSRGRVLAFLDGDDLCCRNWLLRAFAECQSCTRPSIIHPQVNLFFGRKFSHYYWLHPDMRYDDVFLGRLLAENLWTSSILAPIEVFRENPYLRNDIENGFGYEDWSWNLLTAVRGIPHIVARDTIHFIRRKRRDSLMAASNAAHVIPKLSQLPISRLFDPQFLDQPLGRSM